MSEIYKEEYLDLNAVYKDGSLIGQVLLDVPSSGFEDEKQQRVIIIYYHSQHVTRGVILNKEIIGYSLEDVAESIIANNKNVYFPRYQKLPVLREGGEVNKQEGYFLHSPDWPYMSDGIRINRGLYLSAGTNILQDIFSGLGPRYYLPIFGYMEWAPGELESEIMSNKWLTFDVDTTLIWKSLPENLYQDYLAAMHINPSNLFLQNASYSRLC